MTAADALVALACGNEHCACTTSARDGHGVTHCPAHEDKSPSLAVTTGNAGHVLVRCHAGCEQVAVLRALRERGLWKSAKASTTMTRSTTSNATSGADGVTLTAYATAKRLPEGFLTELGVSEFYLDGKPALRIPYRSSDGTEAAVRLRLGLDGAHRFRWRKGSRLLPYGLDRLVDARAAGSIVLVE